MNDTMQAGEWWHTGACQEGCGCSANRGLILAPPKPVKETYEEWLARNIQERHIQERDARHGRIESIIDHCWWVNR